MKQMELNLRPAAIPSDWTVAPQSSCGQLRNPPPPQKKLPHFSISVSERQIFLRSSGKAAAHSWVFETNEYFTVSLSLFLNRAASISDVSQSALYIYLSEYSEGFEFLYQLIEQFKMYYQKKSLVQKPWRRGSVWQAIKADLNAISPSSDYTARQ